MTALYLFLSWVPVMAENTYVRRHFDQERINDARDERRFDYSGPTQTRNAKTESTEKRSDGTVIERLSDGTEIERQADGTIIERQNNGLTIERRTDGTIIRRKGGVELEQRPDGTILRREQDGTVLERRSNGEVYEKRTDGTVHRWTPSDAQASDFDDITPREDEFEIEPPTIKDPELGAFMKFLLIAACVVIVGLLAYFIVKNTRGKNESIDEEQDLSEEELSENIHEMDFDTMIAKLIRDGEYRRVVRLLYLQSLKVLSDKQMIFWEVNKTNWDYFYEIKKTKVRDSFQDITMIFEYVWYGHMPMNDQQFTQIHDHFKSFNKTI